MQVRGVEEGGYGDVYIYLQSRLKVFGALSPLVVEQELERERERKRKLER